MASDRGKSELGAEGGEERWLGRLPPDAGADAPVGAWRELARLEEAAAPILPHAGAVEPRRA